MRTLFITLITVLTAIIFTSCSKSSGSSMSSGLSALNGGSTKKGVGMWGSSPSRAKNVGASWTYNWKPSSWAGTDPDVEYVPMVWSGNDVNSSTISALKSGGYSELLGFNEPDHSDQSNMSVDQAIALWPQLMETGLRLGSPAPASWQNWLPDFMSRATANNYRVDFIALHIYSNISDPNAVSDLQAALTTANSQYGLPIWLTEFGACNFAGSYSQSDIDSFIAAALPMLESLSFVERYSWFSDLSFSGCPMSNVFNDSSGSLTQTGTDYLNAGGTSVFTSIAGANNASGSSTTGGTQTATQATKVTIPVCSAGLTQSAPPNSTTNQYPQTGSLSQLPYLSVSASAADIKQFVATVYQTFPIFSQIYETQLGLSREQALAFMFGDMSRETAGNSSTGAVIFRINLETGQGGAGHAWGPFQAAVTNFQGGGYESSIEDYTGLPIPAMASFQDPATSTYAGMKRLADGILNSMQAFGPSQSTEKYLLGTLADHNTGYPSSANDQNWLNGYGNEVLRLMEGYLQSDNLTNNVVFWTGESSSDWGCP